jgi:hypothetical protein
MSRWILTMGLCAAVVALGSPAGADESPTKVSGYFFGDAYWMAANHEAALESSNGFWLRRVYLTVDHKLDDGFSTRLRMEMGSPGDFTTSAKLVPFVKDAYLKWKRGRHSVLFGISGTPTWGALEKSWGYRSIEKTPLDLQKWGSSRDFGVAVKGALDVGKKVRYHVMLGNGNSTKSETNDGKKVMASLGFHPNEHLFLEGYVDVENRVGETDRTTYQGFAGYKGSKGRVGVHYARQEREQGVGTENLKLDLLSGFAVLKASDTVNLFSRVDVMSDANPSAAKISYLPFAEDAEATFYVVGVDFVASDQVNIMPNVEFITYKSTLDGVEDPASDVMGRITTFVRF